MPQLHDARQVFSVPTEESPNLPIESSRRTLFTTTNAVDSPVVVTSSSRTTFATTRLPPSAETTTGSATEQPVAQFTTLFTTNSKGLPLTIVGSIIPLTGTGINGVPFQSAIANRRTTIGLLTAGTTTETASTTKTASPTPSTQNPTVSSSVAPSTSSGGLSSGDIAAAVVVPILVVIGVLVGFLLLRRRRRRRNANQPTAASANDDITGPGDDTVDARPAMTEHKKRGLPFGVSRYQRSQNTGSDSSRPLTTSGKSTVGQSLEPRPYANNQNMSSAGASTKSNPFTDGSNRSASDGRSDALTGYSGAATDAEHASSNDRTMGADTPVRAVSPMHERAFSPIPESERGASRDVDDDAISDVSDEADYHDADVQVAQAHMGRAHRASVITMRGMISEQNSSAESSPKSGSPVR